MKKIVLYVYYNGLVTEYELINNKHNVHIYIDLSMTLPIQSINGEWYIMPIESLVESKIKLRIGDKIILPIPEQKEKAVLYVEQEIYHELILKKYHIDGINQILIGSSENDAIVYDAYDMKPGYAVISIQNGKASISAKKKRNVYINGKKTQSALLSYGDTIHIMGLKLFYLGEILAVNPSVHFKKCNLPNYTPLIESDKLSSRNSKKIEESFFQRSPRIIKKLAVGERDIDSPPPPVEQKEQPLLLTIGPAFTMGIAMMMSLMFTMYTSRNNPAMLIPGIAMTGAMLAGTILWPILSRVHRKLTKRKKEKKRIKRYRMYMQKEYSDLEEKIAYNKKTLLSTYPEPDILINRAMNRDRRLWERMPSNKDFLDIRLGTGTLPPAVTIKKPKDRFSMIDDRLLKELKDINANFDGIVNMPIAFSLLENTMLGMIGDRQIIVDTAMATILQITALHSYDEVKIVCLFSEAESKQWEWIKQLPHIWASKKSMRFIASSRDEARDVLLCLKELLDERNENQEDLYDKEIMHLPHFIVYIADPVLVEDELVMRHLTNVNTKLGVSTIFVYDRLNLLPKECNAFIQCSDSETNLYHKNNPEAGLLEFKPDSVIGKPLENYSRALAGIKIKEIVSSASLPSMLTFLEMYQVGCIEKLNIKMRWQNNLSYRTLEAPLGIKAGGTPFLLNIHEKYHGPHGLIAGMTGSGKSEFIQSYILSMALNYHPHDVSFILIDYKGGGMANCFIGLPHISGTITNLGGNQIRRSLVSLKSELKKRQRIFAEYGVNHIDKYQQLYKEGKACDPLPHLVMISDEFAELKAGQPEFMQELVSAARIGRSLGVHLILATQKPSGVVDDQIWSNTRFRICLKVLDKSDSNEMLKRPEAANIKEPGRCYVQVGNNEIYELVQSGWSGGAYIPTDKIENEEDNQVSLIDKCGRRVHTYSCKSKPVKSTTTQLSAIVDFISDTAKRDDIVPLKLWLDPLKERIYIHDIDARETGWTGNGWQEVNHWLCPCVGLVDDPKNQQQLPLEWNIGEEGHIAIFGSPGTGKTTLLQTLIYSLVISYSPELVNIYILDFGGRTMGYYQDLPHVGGTIFSEDEDKVNKLFKMLLKELAHRKKQFSEYGVGTLNAYMEASKQKMAAMFMILDNFEAFNELYPDYETAITTLSREGGNYGLYMVLTASNASAIKFRIAQNIKLMCALQLNDKYDYASIVGQTNGLEPEQVKGRGLFKIGTALEFQTALANDSENEADRVQCLRKVFSDMKKEWQGLRAKPIPYVPETLTLNSLLEHEDGQAYLEKELIPIGYDVEEAEIIALDFNNINVYTILGNDMTGKTNVLKVLLGMMVHLNWKAYIIEHNETALQNASSKYHANGYINTTEGFDSFMEELVNEMKLRHKDLKVFRSRNEEDISELDYMSKYQKIVVLIDNYNSFFELISDNALNIMENLIKNGSGLGVCFVFTAHPEQLSNHTGTPLYQQVFRGLQGLLLGGRMDTQSIFDVTMDYKQRSVQLNPGCGYLIDRNSYRTIRAPLM